MESETRPRLTGNKTELAHKLRVTTVTLTRWLLRYGPAFPVVQRGDQGRDWIFDFEEVFGFLRERREEEARADAERDQQLAQLALPFDVGESSQRSTAKDELLAWRLRRLQREEAERARDLVPAAAMGDAAAALVADIVREAEALLRQLATENSWPESYKRTVADRSPTRAGARRPVSSGRWGADWIPSPVTLDVAPSTSAIIPGRSIERRPGPVLATPGSSLTHDARHAPDGLRYT
jgi:phage terminase Nu1 subunit (DNA packaging protein)